MSLLTTHLNPQPSEIVQRWKFNSRNRKPEESIIEYVADLRKLAQDCNYGDTLTVMLRDRLVCGVNDDKIQRSLLLEEILTFDTALRKAQAIEAAIKNMKDLNCLSEGGQPAAGTIDKMDARVRRHSRRENATDVVDKLVQVHGRKVSQLW